MIRAGDPCAEADRLLKSRNYRAAAKVLKRAVLNDPDNHYAYSQLAAAYLKLGESLRRRELIILAEDAAKKAVTLAPDKDSYHDQVIAAARLLGRLGELSAEYHSRISEGEKGAYGDALKKIAAIGIASIPRPREIKKRKNMFLKRVLNYFVLPGLVSSGITGVISRRYEFQGIAMLFLAAGYISFSLVNRTSRKTPEGW